MDPPTQFASFIVFFIRFLEIFSCHHVKPNKTKLFGISWECSVVKIMLSRVHYGSKAQQQHLLSFSLHFFYYSRDIYPNPIFSSFLLIKNVIFFHLLPKLCKINPNFNHILSNEITVGANRNFFTLTRNGLKAIAASQHCRLFEAHFFQLSTIFSQTILHFLHFSLHYDKISSFLTL